MDESNTESVRRGVRKRASGETAVLTAYVTPELGVAVKLHAAKVGSTVSAIVSEALTHHLDAGRT